MINCSDDQSLSTQLPSASFTFRRIVYWLYKGMRLAYPSVFAGVSDLSVSILLTHFLKMCLSCLDDWLRKHLALIDTKGGILRWKRIFERFL